LASHSWIPEGHDSGAFQIELIIQSPVLPQSDKSGNRKRGMEISFIIVRHDIAGENRGLAHAELTTSAVLGTRMSQRTFLRIVV
jgi:hypothetical protein